MFKTNNFFRVLYRFGKWNFTDNQYIFTDSDLESI